MSARSQAAMIERHVDTYGENLTLRGKSISAYNPTTRTTTRTFAASVTFKARVRRYRQRDIDGDSIRLGDLEARASGQALSDAGITIARGDTVTRDGTNYRVEESVLEGAGGTEMLRILQLRGVE